MRVVRPLALGALGLLLLRCGESDSDGARSITSPGGATNAAGQTSNDGGGARGGASGASAGGTAAGDGATTGGANMAPAGRNGASGGIDGASGGSNGGSSTGDASNGGFERRWYCCLRRRRERRRPERRQLRRRRARGRARRLLGHEQDHPAASPISRATVTPARTTGGTRARRRCRTATRPPTSTASKPVPHRPVERGVLDPDHAQPDLGGVDSARTCCSSRTTAAATSTGWASARTTARPASGKRACTTPPTPRAAATACPRTCSTRSAGLGSAADWQPTCGLIQAGTWYHVVGEYTTLQPARPTARTLDSTRARSTSGSTASDGTTRSHGQTGCMSQYNVVPQRTTAR